MASSRFRDQQKQGIRVAALIFLATLIPCRAALAQDEGDPEVLISRGNELRKSGHDELALPLYKRAHELAHTPRTAGQLGLAELAVGYWLESDTHLTEALSYPDHPWVAKNRKALDDAHAIAAANIGTVVVHGSPAGAEVRVNGKTVGRLPLPTGIRVGKGSALIELRADGDRIERRNVDVQGGREQLVQLDLVADRTDRLASAGTREGASTPPASGEQRAAAQARPTEPPPASYRSPASTVVETEGGGWSSRRRRWGYGLAGAGLLVAGGGLGLAIWAAHDASNARSQAEAAIAQTMPTSDQASYNQAKSNFDSATTRNEIGWVFAGIGAAAAVTGAVLLLTAREDSSSTAAAVAPWLSGSSALGLSLAGCW